MLFSKYFKERLQQRIDLGRVYTGDTFEQVPPAEPEGVWRFIRRLLPGGNN